MPGSSGKQFRSLHYLQNKITPAVSMVEDPYSSMIRLLAVNLATDGLFDNIVREKVEMMRDSNPDQIRSALLGVLVLNDMKRN